MSWFPEAKGAALEKLGFAAILAFALILLVWFASRRLRTQGGIEKEIIPTNQFSLFGFFDIFVEGFVAFHDSILGEHNRRFAPLCGSIFLFVFTANLLGLVPGFPAITTTVGVNLGIAVVVFLAFNLYGIREHGPLGYFKHFFGGPQLVEFPLVLVGALVCAVEIFSACLRVMTLNLRLYWNISADHLVLSTVTGLAAYVVPVFFYLLGTFVCFMQAFVFTVLTMIYILLATQHGDEEH